MAHSHVGNHESAKWTDKYGWYIEIWLSQLFRSQYADDIFGGGYQSYCNLFTEIFLYKWFV